MEEKPRQLSYKKEMPEKQQKQHAETEHLSERRTTDIENADLLPIEDERDAEFERF